MVSRPAAGGGCWVEVAPERLSRWLAGFAERHGGYAVSAGPHGPVLRAADGELAELYPPPGAPPDSGDLAGFVAQAGVPRSIGLLLVRRAAAAIGVADGARLVSSKVETAYVQGRTAAGGWSQQRFARRRDNQARAATERAAEVAGRLLVPVAGQLAAVVAGGDRRAVDAVLADPRLARLRPLLAQRFLEVAEPRLEVLRAAVPAARAVGIRVARALDADTSGEPGPGPGS